jgi:hypothetical protein
MAYAGRRAQSLSGDPELVGKRVRRLLTALRPTVMVGAAADGADLLVLEAALAIPNGPAVHIVLPTTRDTFREDSVEPGWRDRFDAALEEVSRRGGTIETLDLEPGEAAYRRANQAMLDAATGLAEGGQRSVALTVARRGEGQMVNDFLNRAELRGIPHLLIDPSVDIPARPRCFVAMPYGTKTDPLRKIDVNCDQVYEKILVPALENAQLYYRRADEEIDSGVVLEPMIEWLAEADLVIADLVTGNFNVGWELGLRHLMRSEQTLLIGPQGTRAPFDVASLRHVRYGQTEQGVSDDAAIAAWQDLQPYLARAGESTDNSDSPVAVIMDVRQWSEVRRRTVRDEHWETLRQELSLARDLHDADQMIRVLADAQDITDTQRRLLRAEAGIGLVRLSRFTAAQPLLHEMVTGDPNVERPEAHIYYAQSLYRPKEAAPEALDEAEAVLKRILVKHQSYPEARALLGAIAKRRLRFLTDRDARRRNLRLALDSYLYDFERNLNLYYEGINVVAISVALALNYGDTNAGRRAEDLLVTVRVAARLALRKPGEQYWAAATIAECQLHEHLLSPAQDTSEVRAAYRVAGGQQPTDGDLDSTLTQLEFLRSLNLPDEPITAARDGLLDGAGRNAG